ncbi:hypothetical protein [Methylobacterium bullatum]
MRFVKASLLLVMLVSIAIPNSAVAAGLGSLVKTELGWNLYKKVDSFTDKTKCVIASSKDARIQVSKGTMYVDYSRKGGVQGYEYRIDNDPSSGMRLPTETAKSLGFVSFSGQDLSAILGARRLRIQVLTYVSGLKEEDIDVRGLYKLYDQMVQGCLS